MREVVYQSIITCARCGQNHARLAFAKFAHQPITDTDGTVWGWWATCPLTGEPLLLRIAFTTTGEPNGNLDDGA